MTFQRDLAWAHIEQTNRASIAHQIARYALAMNYTVMPEKVVHQAKRSLLDALGCAIGAYEAPGREICEGAVKEIGGMPEATVFCSGLRTSVTNASLVNAFLVRFLDYNDWGGGGHNSDCLASILAVAEREKSNGKDFLTSLVISYELGARYIECFTKSLAETGWSGDQRAGVNQPPALGRLMGMNEEQIANAIGLCMSHTIPMGILDAHREENVMAKNLRFGWAAHDAIIACKLAKRGFTGPVRVLDSATAGVRKVVAQGEMDFEKLIDFSGWRILDVRHKAMCANGTTHGHVFATMGIVKEHDLKPEDIESVHIKAHIRETLHTTAAPKKYPRNAESADHSAFYGNALAIKERHFGPSSFAPEKFTDPVILDLIERITIEADPSLTKYQAISEVITKDGRRFKNRIDVPRGLGDNALTDKELEEKFSEMASKHMGNEQIKKIFDLCWNAEKLDDLGKLTKLMIFPAAKS